MSYPERSVSLAWLLEGIAELPADLAVRIDDLTLDSREVRNGSLFFALRGHRVHGMQFSADAAGRGASAVLWDPEERPQPDGTLRAAAGRANPSTFVSAVPGLKRMLGHIADRFFGRPSSHMRVLGITGTNGKTTSAYLLAQCLQRLDFTAAYIGTLGWGRLDALEAQTHTTPDVITVHRRLAKLRARGVRYVAMEVSSHALDQGRVDGVLFHCAAFTNLSRDHLDYHLSMQAYGEAKARLFAMPGLRHAIINIGDEFGRHLALHTASRALLTAVWVGEGDYAGFADRALYASRTQLELDGVSMVLEGSFGSAALETRLLGRFNAENAVLAAGCLLTSDVPLPDAVQALSQCSAPPGRMELVSARAGAEPLGAKPLAVIDYAHTPDALAKALGALREHCRGGALWCVFGCGGDRDSGKRPMMGAIAEEFSNHVIVTDDNPRSENPDAITADIMAGIRSPSVRIIHDRGTAIAAAINEASPGDIVLIAGKGHEEYQIYGDVRRVFSDRDEARHLLEAA